MERRFRAETSGWTHEQLLAVALDVLVAHADESQFFGVVPRALELMPAGRTTPEILTRIDALVSDMRQTTAVQRAVMLSVWGSASAGALRAELGELRRDLMRAYPLLAHFQSYYGRREPGPEYAEYIAHTPPRLPEKAEAAAA